MHPTSPSQTSRMDELCSGLLELQCQHRVGGSLSSLRGAFSNNWRRPNEVLKHLCIHRSQKCNPSMISRRALDLSSAKFRGTRVASQIQSFSKFIVCDILTMGPITPTDLE
ncbi:uncharacterized protein LOC108680143 [Hyalella azteca]|uniref:Uncharacterized protein LOC108680143 n=1 Tax=Hyalella azteca TaxID=294128 RepID=A0A8B7PE43_HYAAZ|nr:uncharacterized protein LOC108680143 [Hyalella azteca]